MLLSLHAIFLESHYVIADLMADFRALHLFPTKPASCSKLVQSKKLKMTR